MTAVHAEEAETGGSGADESQTHHTLNPQWADVPLALPDTLFGPAVPGGECCWRGKSEPSSSQPAPVVVETRLNCAAIAAYRGFGGLCCAKDLRGFVSRVQGGRRAA